METKEILQNIIEDIEENIAQKLTIEDFAEKYFISPVHLQRIFSFVFHMPLAEYIRLRKMQRALELLLYEPDKKICDIAYDTGFGYESSFIRSFKREFSITPSEARKNPHILKIVPPLCMEQYNDIGEGGFTDMDFVMLPKMHLAGKRYMIPFEDSLEQAPEIAVNFWKEDAAFVTDKLQDDVYIGLTRTVHGDAGYSYYIPSVPVKENAKLPKGFVAEEMEATLAVRFRYIGRHHYYELNASIADAMYQKIDAFLESVPGNMVVPYEYYFEKIETSSYHDGYCMMEWYTPVLLMEDSLET